MFFSIFLHFWAPFGEPKCHQNGAQKRPKTKTKNKMQKIPLREPLGAVFGRFQCAVVLQNRVPAQGKHTFLKNFIFDINLREDILLDRFCLQKWLRNASLLAPKTVKKRSEFWAPFQQLPAERKLTQAQTKSEGFQLSMRPKKGLVLIY